MNMLTDSLPSTVTVSGRQYRIHTGYRNWIRFELLMLDRTIPIQRKVVEILKLVYAEELPPTLGDAMDEAFLFYARPRNEKTGAEERKKSKQVYSFAHDDEYIYAAFLAQYPVYPKGRKWRWKTKRFHVFGNYGIIEKALKAERGNEYECSLDDTRKIKGFAGRTQADAGAVGKTNGHFPVCFRAV